MEKETVEEYIQKLKMLEKGMSSEEDNDDVNFIGELDSLLSRLTADIQQTQTVNNTDFSLKIKVKKLHENAIVPSYSKLGDAGMDLTITDIKSNTTFDITYGFGIAIEIPKGFVGLVFPRSSVRNYELNLSNCVGVIDSGYRGEIQATFKKTNGLDSMSYKVGDRGAQIIVLPYPQVSFIESDTLSDTERGNGGFGSTGV
jgi:dUTP pyrophosphatase